jgi:hypothetical protein
MAIVYSKIGHGIGDQTAASIRISVSNTFPGHFGNFHVIVSMGFRSSDFRCHGSQVSGNIEIRRKCGDSKGIADHSPQGDSRHASLDATATVTVTSTDGRRVRPRIRFKLDARKATFYNG